MCVTVIAAADGVLAAIHAVNALWGQLNDLSGVDDGVEGDGGGNKTIVDDDVGAVVMPLADRYRLRKQQHNIGAVPPESQMQQSQLLRQQRRQPRQKQTKQKRKKRSMSRAVEEALRSTLMTLSTVVKHSWRYCINGLQLNSNSGVDELNALNA